MTKTFAVIGDPIDHSMSPNIHSAAFRELGMDCAYIAYRIPKGELADGLEGLKKISIAGFNVTIPHKIEMMGYLDRVDESCSLIGAANTVANTDGMLKGYNTDMDGFLDPLRERLPAIRGSSVLLLGAGGAARAVVAGLAREKAGKITIANRTPRRAAELAGFAQRMNLKAAGIGIDQVGETARDYDVIVNATAAGLRGEASPVSLKGIGAGTIVYDIVYAPMNTDFIKKAKEEKATIIFGYEMLLGQAARTFEIWHGVKPPYAAMKRALLGGF